MPHLIEQDTPAAAPAIAANQTSINFKLAEAIRLSREPTVSVYDHPQLSRKNMPNARGNRDDVPAFSVRQSPSFRSVPGGQS